MKIRVLHLIKTLNLGGAETNLLNLVRHTDRARFDVHVGYSYGGEIESQFRDAGVTLFKFADKSHRVKSAASAAIVWRLWRYVRKHRIQIVHTHNFSSHVWGAAAAKLGRAKLVEHVHDFRYLEPSEFARRRGENDQYRYVKYLKRLSDRVIVLTRQNREYVVKNGICPPDRVREIQNGIPLADERPKGRAEALARLGLPEGARVVLTLCRVAPEKNVELLFDVVPDVLKTVPRAVFVVAGDGPLLDRCRERCRREGLEASLRFIGFRADVRELLRAAGVFLLPSFLELHSIATLEAMSLGVPVVVSRGVGCNDEFISHGENGFLLDPFLSEGWAETVAALLQNDALRVITGEAGKRTCRERFGIERAAKAKEELYAELVGE